MMFLEGIFFWFWKLGGSLGLDLYYYPLLFFVFNHGLKIFGWDVLGGITATYWFFAILNWCNCLFNVSMSVSLFSFWYFEFLTIEIWGPEWVGPWGLICSRIQRINLNFPKKHNTSFLDMFIKIEKEKNISYCFVRK